MHRARLLAQYLLQQEGSAKDFIKGLARIDASVHITVGAPAPNQRIVVPVTWFKDLVFQSGHDHPGVHLRSERSLSLRPQGVTPEQWDWMLELIEYALNEGPEFSGCYAFDPPSEEEYPPRIKGTSNNDGSMLFTPAFTWFYTGGKTAYARHKDMAYERAPRFRQG